MAAFNVTSLGDFGYPETSGFTDPMEDRFRAKPYRQFSAAEVEKALESFSMLGAYAEGEQVEDALNEYWATYD